MNTSDPGSRVTSPAADTRPRREQAPRKPRRAMPVPSDVGDGQDPRAALGRIVHHHRIALGISQEDLADQVGLDRTYVSGIERGIRNPTFLVLLRLAKALEIAPARFMECDDEKPVG